MWNFSLIKCQILTAKFHMCVMKDCDRFRQTPNECLLFDFTMKKSHTHSSLNIIQDILDKRFRCYYNFFNKTQR